MARQGASAEKRTQRAWKSAGNSFFIPVLYTAHTRIESRCQGIGGGNHHTAIVGRIVQTQPLAETAVNLEPNIVVGFLTRWTGQAQDNGGKNEKFEITFQHDVIQEF